MSSRPLEEISLEPISECSFPMINLFDFGYPKADDVNRYCMCEEQGDFTSLDDAISKGEDVTSLVSNFTCRSYICQI